MRVRIVSSIHCPNCKDYLDRLNKRGYNYEIYDADDTKNTAQLDEWNIVDMPVVQIVTDGGKLLYSFPAGTWSPRLIDDKMEDLK